MILNLRLWNRHLQIWCWGWGFIPSESGRNCFRLAELFIWRRMTRDKAVNLGFVKQDHASQEADNQ